MNIRRAVPALAAVLALGTSAAFATSFTLTGSYTVGDTYNSSDGGPSIGKQLPDPFSESLTVGTETTATNFFTTNPAGSCSGGGCSGSNGTETDPLTITFSNLDIAGIGTISSWTADATYIAKYSGTELSCADGDGISPSSGDTDCVIWNGAADTYNGWTMASGSIGHGYDLDIYFYNATDWNITPKIGFELVHSPSVPEPPTLALFAAGLAALCWTARRRGKAS